MKILIYAHMFPPTSGGTQYSNLEIAKGLYTLNHKIEVIACNNKGAKEFISKLPFSVHLLPKWRFTTMQSLSRRGLFNWFFAFWYFLIFKKKIRQFKPEVAFIADETSNCFWGMLAKNLKFPYVSYCSVPHLAVKDDKRYINFIQGLKQIIYRCTRKKIKKLIYNSYYHSISILSVSLSTKNQLSKKPNLAKKIHIVPRSVDNSFFNTPSDLEEIHKVKKIYNISNNHFVILSVANLNRVKGIEDVLYAIKRLNQFYLNKIKYLIVGDGPDLLYLKKLTEELRLNKNVFFVGNIIHSKIIVYYDVSNLFVLPSRKGALESFGRVFVEAATRSVTSIGVREGGMIDIIDNGKTGFLVSVRNIEEIKEKIIFFIENPKKRKEMGENARKKAEKLYNTRAVSLKIEKYLKNAVSLYRNTGKVNRNKIDYN